MHNEFPEPEKLALTEVDPQVAETYLRLDDKGEELTEQFFRLPVTPITPAAAQAIARLIDETKETIASYQSYIG